MANYYHVILFSLLGGIVSLLGGILLLRGKRTADKLAKYATPFAAGALLAAVFLDLLPEGLHESSEETVLMSALIGIVGFFFAERFLFWFHHHHDHPGDKKDPAINLIIFGDITHNVLDGVAIAAAFLISVPTGIVTTLAVAAHEIPQEIGDFGVLLARGMRRRKVLLVNIASALATVVAAVVTFSLGSADKLPIGALLGLSAGFLLYVALSDLIPSIHESTSNRKLFDLQPMLFLLGIIIVGLTIQFTHGYIESQEAHAECSPSTSCVEDEHRE